MSNYKPALIPIVYGLILLTGGIMGYVNAQSLPSLIGGLALGIPIVVAGLSILRTARSGFYSSLGLVIIATLFFHYRFVMSGQFYPSGIMAIVSVATLIAMFIWRPKY